MEKNIIILEKVNTTYGGVKLKVRINGESFWIKEEELETWEPPKKDVKKLRKIRENDRKELDFLENLKEREWFMDED